MSAPTLGFLQVEREGDVRHATLRDGGSHSEVDEVDNVRRAHDPLVEDGDVLEQVIQVDVLLVQGSDQVVVGHAGEGQDRRLVHLGVIQTVQQVDRTRAGGRQAHPEAARELGIAAGHERRRLLVTDMHEPDLPSFVRIAWFTLHSRSWPSSGATWSDPMPPQI